MDNSEFTEIELDALAICLRDMSAKEIQYCLNHNMVDAKQRPYFEAHLPHKIQEERNAPVTMYHRRKAPEGKIFKTYEVSTLKKGWVDSPDKIKDDIRDKLINKLNMIANKTWDFWCKEWKWIIGTIITTLLTIAGLYLVYLQYILQKTNPK